jgi:hypothetical protein
MRRHLNYANVVATFALVFAMSGGALAAKHYLINSTKQINPKILKALKGNAGKPGPAGTPGAAGKEGPAGKEGAKGNQGLEGPRGPSDAYEASSPESTSVTTQPKELSVKLPAGSYDITGVTQLQNFDSTHTATVRCDLKNGATDLTYAYIDAPVVVNSEFGDSDAVLHSTLETSTETTVVFTCVKNGSLTTEIKVNNPSLSAISVGKLH